MAAAVPYRNKAVDGINNAPHYIMFTGKEGNNAPTNIFNCAVTTTGKTFIVENVVLNRNARLILTEAEIHMFIGWFLELLPTWAMGYGRDLVIVTMKMPHATEWMIEYGYTIKKKDLLGVDKGFRGMGMAANLCCKGKLPF